MTDYQKQAKEIRKDIKKMAKIALTWKDKKEETQIIQSDKFIEEVTFKNVHQRLCSLSDNVNMTVVNVLFEKDGYIAPHTHDRIEYAHVISGSYTNPITNITYTQGMTEVIPPHTLHASKSDHCLLTVTWQPAYETVEIPSPHTDNLC